MQRFPEIKVLFGTVILVTFHLLACCDATAGEHRKPSKYSMVMGIDSKAKLNGFNRALSERLQHTETALRPLQVRVEKLQRRFRAVKSPRQQSADPSAARTERSRLLQEALQVRAAVERKLLGFGALNRSYRNMRMLLEPKKGTLGSPTSSAGLPRAWLDRDTERQMGVNERVYKNIIDLLVHLIECPVNIIHDMMGSSSPSSPSSTPPPFPASGSSGNEDSEEQQDDSVIPLYDVNETEGSDGVAEPWLEEFHY